MDGKIHLVPATEIRTEKWPADRFASKSGKLFATMYSTFSIQNKTNTHDFHDSLTREN